MSYRRAATDGLTPEQRGFRERGLAATTPADLADAVGISRQRLYAFTSGVEALAVDVLRDGHQRWLAAARDAAAADPSAVRDPLAQLVAWSTDGLPTTTAVPRLLVELRGRVGEPERVHADQLVITGSR